MTNDKSRNMQVVLRVRPLSRRELEQNQRSIIRVADPNTIIFDPDEDEDEFFFHGTKQTHRDITKRVSKNLTMAFDQVFDNQARNVDVFEYSMRPLVQSVMQGYNCSAFVYGATGAGKTFTMLGSADNPGVTYLTMRELFEQIEHHSGERKFDIGISYLEVYNEQVMNLLTKTGPLKLREDSNGVVVGGLVLKPIYAADELLDLLALGNRNRTQHPTDANAESSRSHAIFQVHIRMTNKASGEKRMVKLSMIDLAGSERGSSTKCEGQRFKEGASINKSLLALGNCINKLADGSKHIPYRDSNMTRILKDSLGGNCRTVMIANVSPSSLTFEDTYNTLKYAGRAQKIRTTAITKNLFKSNLPKEYYVRKLTDTSAEVDGLKAIIQKLEAQLAATNSKNSNAYKPNQAAGLAALLADKESWRQKLDKVYTDLRVACENYFAMSSKEKLLKVRIKFKETLEQNRKLFNMNGDCLKRDVARAEASIGKFGKQMEVYGQDKDRWMDRCKDNRRQLNALKADIEKLNNPLLESYLCEKDAEQKNAEMKLKSDHQDKILHMYSQEIDKLRKAVALSGEIAQETYFVLQANLLLTDDVHEKLNQLYKSYDQRGVKFAECDENGTHDLDVSSDAHAYEHLHDANISICISADDDILTAGHKRMRALSEETDALPTKKRVNRSIYTEPEADLNATQVLEVHGDGNANGCLDSTFAIKPTAGTGTDAKKPAQPLKESNPNIHKDFAVPRAKPPYKVKTTLTSLQREKENKRTPFKLRKSPRRSPLNAVNRPGNRPKSTKTTDLVVKQAREDIVNRLKAVTQKKWQGT